MYVTGSYARMSLFSRVNWYVFSRKLIWQVKRTVTALVFANWTVFALDEILLSMCQNSRAVSFRFISKTQWQMFLLFTAAMLVPLGRAPTWRFHTKLYKFRWNSFPNHAGMKNRTDLNFGEVVYLSIIYHISDSWLNLLNGYDFYFRCKPPIETEISPRGSHISK